MPSETSPSSTGPAPTPTPGAQEVAAGGAGDSSFETVAEALRLQWSVIGEDLKKICLLLLWFKILP